MNTPATNAPENEAKIVHLPGARRAGTTQEVDRKQRFRVLAFQNPGGTPAWRVTGIRRDGSRVRENYGNHQDAEARRLELSVEYLNTGASTAMRATELTHEQLLMAEAAIRRLGADWLKLLDAVTHWLKTGQQAAAQEEVPRLDKAVEQFKAWVDLTPTLRDRTKRNLKLRVGMFGAGIANHRISDIRPEHVEEFLDKRQVSAVSRDNDRRTLTRFFAWCGQRPRHWCTTNPAREVRVERSRDVAPPAILTVEEAAALLASAENHKGGLLVPYVALCLFGGLRPFEAARLTWAQVLLKDGEVRIEGHQSKTRRPRTIQICAALKAWLRAYQDTPIMPANFRKHFDSVKLGAGFAGREADSTAGLKPWKEDLMRHTSITHHFRLTGSYGLVAEMAGNSEAVIKRHYQGRVTTADTKKFFALRPAKSGKAKGRTAKKK